MGSSSFLHDAQIDTIRLQGPLAQLGLYVRIPNHPHPHPSPFPLQPTHLLSPTRIFRPQNRHPPPRPSAFATEQPPLIIADMEHTFTLAPIHNIERSTPHKRFPALKSRFESESVPYSAVAEAGRLG